MSGFSRNPVDLGQRFDRLTVISLVGIASDGHRVWRLVCDCGAVCERPTNSIKAKGVKSCGCFQSDAQRVHGGRYTTEYRSWQGAKARCKNEKSKDFERYGGRGIRMCERWSQSFQAFLEDMGEKPPGMSLERKDTNGDYCPENCVWATNQTQNRNKRASVWIDWKGQKTHLADVAKELGITYGAAFMRLKRGNFYEYLS